MLEPVIATTGVEGNRQRNLNVHGGPDRTLCLFLQDRIEWLQSEHHSIEAGFS
jgi:MOSC domain-containing protein YiiM